MIIDVTIVIVLEGYELHPYKTVNLMNVVYVLTDTLTTHFPPSFPLLRLPSSLRHNNFKLDQLISLQWALNVQMKGPISHFKSKATNFMRRSKQNSLIADTEKDLEV